jgi:hypothetical protein
MRIWEAQRAGLRLRLRDAWHLGENRADALLAEWDQEAVALGLTKLAIGYWTQAEAWLRAQIRAREDEAPP